jgi:hypothetical protein
LQFRLHKPLAGLIKIEADFILSPLLNDKLFVQKNQK